MNFLEMLEQAPEPRYFLSILACGTTFRETNQNNSNDTYCNDLSNIVSDYIDKYKYRSKGNAITFEQITQAIEKCFEKSERLDLVTTEDIGALMRRIGVGTKEQREAFGYDLIKKFKDIDIPAENALRVVNKAITTCEIDDYVLSAQSNINDVRELDEKINKIFNLIIEHKEEFNMDDAVCLYRQKGHRLVHEFFITSKDDTPVSSEAFGKVILKSLESLQAGEEIHNTISEIMLFHRLQYTMAAHDDDETKKVLKHKI